MGINLRMNADINIHVRALSTRSSLGGTWYSNRYLPLIAALHRLKMQILLFITWKVTGKYQDLSTICRR